MKISRIQSQIVRLNAAEPLADGPVAAGTTRDFVTLQRCDRCAPHARIRAHRAAQGVLARSQRFGGSGMWRMFLLAPLILAGAVHAQELTVFAGGLQASETKERSHAWALEYQHALGENIAASFAWLNEGHLPGHHRDGQSVQIWGRANLLDRRLSLAAGLGPYRYFDTTASVAGGDHANIHGWGMVGSLAATYYSDSRWLYKLRFNRIVAGGSVDTNALMLGIGYQLEPVSERGPQVSAPSQLGKTTTDEITAFVGRTIVNSLSSERELGWAFEYRHGLGRHVDVTLGVLNEGDARLVRRSGITAQIWGVREVLASDRLVLGIGLGPYLAIDRYRDPALGEGGTSLFSWIFTASAAFRLSQHWNARVSWNRINTNYNRDTDVILLGAGYRF